MPLKDYVIGGMDQQFKLRLYRTLRALDRAGLVPGITSAFRDDYRQSLASGLHAANNRSYHGGSLRGGYGHGLAADVVSVKGETSAERWAASEQLWKWIDAHGKEFEMAGPISIRIRDIARQSTARNMPTITPRHWLSRRIRTRRRRTKLQSTTATKKHQRRLQPATNRKIGDRSIYPSGCRLRTSRWSRSPRPRVGARWQPALSRGRASLGGASAAPPCDESCGKAHSQSERRFCASSRLWYSGFSPRPTAAAPQPAWSARRRGRVVARSDQSAARHLSSLTACGPRLADISERLLDRWPVLLLGGRQLQRGLERSETRIGKRGDVIGRQLRVMRPVGWSWLLGRRKCRAGHHQHCRAGNKCLPHGDLQEFRRRVGFKARRAYAHKLSFGHASATFRNKQQLRKNTLENITNVTPLRARCSNGINQVSMGRPRQLANRGP